MRGFRVLLFKELKDYFTSPLTYILTALFCALLGWIFFNYLIAAKEVTLSGLGKTILIPTFGVINSIFMFLAPILTMRSFAEEKKMKTLDLLFLSKLSNTQIVLAKFFSLFILAQFMIIFTFLFPFILSFSGFNDWGMVLTGYTGIALIVMCYLSVGIFTSTLTENQFVSVFAAFVIILGLMLLGLTANATHNRALSDLIGYLSIGGHYGSFARGALISYDIFYMICFVGFFLYLSLKSLELRKW